MAKGDLRRREPCVVRAAHGREDAAPARHCRSHCNRGAYPQEAGGRKEKYETKSGPRLSADDVMRHTKLHEYQNSYAAAMKPFGLQRGIVGSIAKHQANSEYYRQRVIQYEEDIAKLQADVEKAQEGRNTILAWFGKGDLAKAKKELADKDRLIAELNRQIKALQVEKARLQEQHKSEIGKLRNGYQAEIDKAIRRAETAERQSEEKDAVIDRQRKQIGLKPSAL